LFGRILGVVKPISGLFTAGGVAAVVVSPFYFIRVRGLLVQESFFHGWS
jgi:hypothetical protein